MEKKEDLLSHWNRLADNVLQQTDEEGKFLFDEDTANQVLEMALDGETAGTLSLLQVMKEGYTKRR